MLTSRAMLKEEKLGMAVGDIKEIFYLNVNTGI